MSIRITDIDGKKPSFVQWDVDRVLYIEGCDSQPCLHFANPFLTRAIVVEAEEDGSRWLCRVPNIILQTAAPIAISVFVQPDEGKTVLTGLVEVQPKLKPQDYTYEENIGYTNWVQKSEEAETILNDITAIRQEIATEAATINSVVEHAQQIADDIVIVAPERPDAPSNRIWIDSDDISNVQVPTMDDIHNVPAGGTTGQVLAKASGTDYDLTWADQAGGGSSDYSDLSNKPSINSVTLAGNKSASDLGLGTYSKPSGGIPKTDLASSVQASLDRADSALQSFTETDPTVPNWAKASSKPTYTASEVGALPADTAIPSKTSDLVNDSGFITSVPEEIFWATYNTTTYAEIKAADDAGKLVMLKAQVGYELPLTQITSNGAQFGVNKADAYYFATVTSTNAWSVQAGNLVDWNEFYAAIGDPNDLTTTATDLTGAANELNSGKLDKAQGVANAGKFLVVGSDGNITLVTMAAWQGGNY